MKNWLFIEFYKEKFLKYFERTGEKVFNLLKLALSFSLICVYLGKKNLSSLLMDCHTTVSHAAKLTANRGGLHTSVFLENSTSELVRKTLSFIGTTRWGRGEDFDLRQALLYH